MSDKEIIQAIIKLFQNEDRFTRTFMARDKFGNPIEPEDPDAYCFCVAGALKRFKASIHLWKKMHDTAVEASGGFMPLTILNDYGGRTAILNLLNQTLETL